MRYFGHIARRNVNILECLIVTKKVEVRRPKMSNQIGKNLNTRWMDNGKYLKQVLSISRD